VGNARKPLNKQQSTGYMRHDSREKIILRSRKQVPLDNNMEKMLLLRNLLMGEIPISILIVYAGNLVAIGFAGIIAA